MDWRSALVKKKSTRTSNNLGFTLLIFFQHWNNNNLDLDIEFLFVIATIASSPHFFLIEYNSSSLAVESLGRVSASNSNVQVQLRTDVQVLLKSDKNSQK